MKELTKKEVKKVTGGQWGYGSVGSVTGVTYTSGSTSYGFGSVSSGGRRGGGGGFEHRF